MFFEETTQNQFLSTFDIITEGDFNTDTGSKNCNKFIQFTDFYRTFDLINLINVKHGQNQPNHSLSYTLFYQADQEVFGRRSLLRSLLLARATAKEHI